MTAVQLGKGEVFSDSCQIDGGRCFTATLSCRDWICKSSRLITNSSDWKTEHAISDGKRMESLDFTLRLIGVRRVRYLDESTARDDDAVKLFSSITLPCKLLIQGSEG